MLDIVKQELDSYKNKKVEIIINEGRSRKRKEIGKIKQLYERTFTIEINNIITSFSYSDIITKTIIINLV